MTAKGHNSVSEKISTLFRSKLNKLSAKEKVRAVVMLRRPGGAKGTGRRQSRQQRRAVIKAIRDAASAAMAEIDEILQRFDGKRLADEPNALGCIPIETSAAGVAAVAESESVEAILEDQPISLLHSK
jgi:sorbitol-specific phosphotransferase system component IIA